MTITLLDTSTGRRRSIESDDPLYYWEEGNGSCDCNRRLIMGADAPIIPDDACEGCKRFLVVACDDPDASLKAMNQGYPADLLAKHGIR